MKQKIFEMVNNIHDEKKLKIIYSFIKGITGR
jgi:hypothetical protein